jgi:hypothetical protein
VESVSHHLVKGITPSKIDVHDETRILTASLISTRDRRHKGIKIKVQDIALELTASNPVSLAKRYLKHIKISG